MFLGSVQCARYYQLSEEGNFMQKHFLKLIAVVFCVSLMVGCNEEAKLKKATPKEADALAREFISSLNKKNLDKAEKLIEPTVRAEAKPKLKSLGDLLSVSAPQEVKIIGVRGQKQGDQRLIQLNYQIYFDKAWVVASIAVIETPKDRYIFSVRMDPLKDSLENLYVFKFFGKSIIHYLTLLVAIVIPLFILYALAQCVRLPGKMKWIWVPFIILGFVSFHLDWMTGRAAIQLISVQIFGVAAAKQKYGPLILSVSLPIGAVAFFIVQFFKKSRKKSPAPL